MRTGCLRFKKSPDYESPGGGGTRRSPTCTRWTVQATDSTRQTRRMKSETVTVNVTNVDEPGTVTAVGPSASVCNHRLQLLQLTDPGPVGYLQRLALVGSGPRPAAKSGSYSDHRRKANSAIYTPKLTATMAPTCGPRSSYEDGEGSEGKSGDDGVGLPGAGSPGQRTQPPQVPCRRPGHGHVWYPD